MVQFKTSTEFQTLQTFTDGICLQMADDCESSLTYPIQNPLFGKKKSILLFHKTGKRECIVHHLLIAGQSCWQNCRSAIGIYSFPLDWEQAKSESIIDPFRLIPRTEWCRGLVVSAIALFTSCICKPENGCINCTKPLITGYNFLSYCNPFPFKRFHFLWNLLTEIQSTVDHNLFTLGDRITFKNMKTSHYFNTHKHTSETKLTLLSQHAAERDCIFILTDGENR